MSADMQAWMEMNKTNEHHEHLKQSVGVWSVAGKFWMDPSQPPQETEGKSTNVAILDGRYIKSDYDSSFGGAPFRGVGIDGYDNMKGKYVSLWMDSMSTGFCVLEGSREGDVTTYFGVMPGPDGKERQVKSIHESKGDGIEFSMFEKRGEDWAKTMELIYTRQS